MSEVLVGSISEASEDIGLSEFFVGVFVVAIVGNAAEHWVAVLVAAKDKMDLAVIIAVGSSAQIALFVAPVLVLLSFVIGPNPMALVFNGYELGGLVFAVLIANFITQDGESNWFEGVQLLALYAVLGPGLLLRLAPRSSSLGSPRGSLLLAALLALPLGLGIAAVGDQRGDDAHREADGDDRRGSRAARSSRRSSISSLTPTTAEHHGDRLVEIAEAGDQPLDQHEERPQPEQREHVAHPDDEGSPVMAKAAGIESMANAMSANTIATRHRNSGVT